MQSHQPAAAMWPELGWWLTLALAVLAVSLLLCVLGDVNSHWLRRGVPQLQSPRLFLGDAGGLFFKGTSLSELYSHVYQRLRGLRFGGFYLTIQPFFMVLDPDLINRITSIDSQYFHENATCVLNKAADPLVRHLFQMDPGCLREMRNRLRKALGPEKTRRMFFLLEECCQRMLRSVGNGGGPVNVELRTAFTRFTTDVIGCCAFGIECGAIDDANSQFVRIATKVSQPTVWHSLRTILHLVAPRLVSLLHLRVFSPELEEFFRRVVSETERYRRDHGILRDDVIHMLLQTRGSVHGSLPEFTDNDVVSQVFLLFAAGFSMTSLVLSHCAFELAHHPAAQTRARLEVDAVLRRHGGNLSYDAVQEMGYLDMVLAETLRLYPPMSVCCRECTSSYRVQGSDVTLRKGDSVCISVTGLHRDPQYWPDPLLFDPERFATRGPPLRPGTYLPFGEGHRTCVGKHFALVVMKAVIATLLSHFEFRPSSRSPYKPNDVIKDGLWVQVSSRTWIVYN